MIDVLHVIDSLGHGGAEQNLLSVMRRLPPHRFRNHLAWLYPDEQLLDQIRPHVATVLPPRARGRLAPLLEAARLASWIRQHRPDLVHAQLLRAQLVGRLGAFLGGACPVVTTWQNTLYDPQGLADFRGSPGLRKALRWMDRQSGRGGHHFIAVSEYVAEHCASQLAVPRDRVTVIFNAVEPERYAEVDPATLARTRAELGLSPGAPVLLSVGRLVSQKAHQDSIRAMPAILRRHPTAVLLIAGSGPLEPKLRAEVDAHGLQSQVRLLGRRRDIPALSQLASLFLFPSRYEGLSVALVEALANGLPAALSDIPPNREVADGLASVRFFPPGDVERLAAEVDTLLVGGEAVRAAARAARSSVRTRFAPEPLAGRFAETLERAAHLNGTCPAPHQIR
jgi:glycosyltransferase involved in cell wall biosynthesis